MVNEQNLGRFNDIDGVRVDMNISDSNNHDVEGNGTNNMGKAPTVANAGDTSNAAGIVNNVHAAKLANTDSPEQAAVINAPENADVLVVAGAGSGKTYTMTRRIINLIKVGVPPEKILGLTFTRKAASELLGRVSSAVAENARMAETDANAAGNPRRTNVFLKPQVSTYDAFFQSIVRQYGLLVGFDQNTQPLSEAGAHQLAVTVIDENMDILRGQGFGSFSDTVSKMLDLSNAISGSMIGEHCTSVPEAIARIREWDQAFIAQMDTAIGDEAVPEDEPKTGKPPKRRKKDTDEQFADRIAEYRAAFHQLAIYRSAGLRDVAKKREILLTLVERYHERKQQLNMAEFNDFTVAAYALITRFPSIGERQRRRYTHVLLDEYQDTSTTQAALIAALFHPDDSQLGSGSSAVNAVGDPFQSIYAWRGASPGAFRMFQRDFGMDETSKPYSLSVTRRNSRVVLEAANDLTQPLRTPDRIPSSSPMREVPVPALSTIDDAKEGTLGVLSFDTLGQEIDAVARFAKTSIARHTPTDPSQKDVRPHVAVLFRGKKNMPEFAEGLRKAGLTTLTVGYSALLDRPEIRDVLALLHVVADHTDSGALMRLLATPRFGLGSSDLSALARLASRRNDEYRFRALAGAGLVPADARPGEMSKLVAEHRDQVPNMVFLADLLIDNKLESSLDSPRVASLFSASGLVAIRHASQVLRQVNAVINHSLTEIIETAVEALDLDIDTVVAQALQQEAGKPVEPALARSPMNALVDLVNTYTQEITEGATPTLRGFVSWVDSLSSIPDEMAAVPNDPVDVVLMSIHQSKGLEWDSVAIVGMKATSFPSNTGDKLKIKLDEEHIGGLRGGVWQSPQYHETADTWLDNPAAVPVPVRADADILPRFPHDAGVGDDPIEALHKLSDVETMANESEGLMRVFDEIDGSDSDTSDAGGASVSFGGGVSGAEGTSAPGGGPVDYLSQQEEYGRRLHADERRLAYVALTRAREEVLMTYSRHAELSRDPEAAGSGHESKPSNFFTEVHDALAYRDDVVVVEADSKANGNDDGGDGDGDNPNNLKTSDIEDMSQSDHSGAAETGDTVNLTETNPSAHPTLSELNAPKPDGLFVGSHAEEYEQAIVEEAWQTPMCEDEAQEDQPLPWPASMSQEMAHRLRRSATLTRRMHESLVAEVGNGMAENDDNSTVFRARLGNPTLNINATGDGSKSGKGRNAQSVPGDTTRIVTPAIGAAEPESVAGAETDVVTQAIDRIAADLPEGQSLAKRTQMLLADEDLMPSLQIAQTGNGGTSGELSHQPDHSGSKAENANEFDIEVRSRGERILASRRQNVTSLQASAGNMSKRESEQYWRALVRPIPRVASPAAQAGTRFHAWAERFVNAFDVDEVADTPVDDGISAVAGASQAETRASLIAGLAQAEQHPEANQTATDCKILTWQRRLVEGRWATRRPYAAEEQIVVAIPELQNRIVNGKLDAVFYGGLDESDPTKRFTIVDWKTGKKPTKQEDIDQKLTQLDMYRLMFAQMKNIPLESVDATLYYVSVASEDKRAVYAKSKSKPEILKELNAGIPVISDED
ncbi:UvrD-helicase domain-containing protein [Bifidobacterium sp. ESL0728]|uniref:UvrD-helicase domain-containing protein n=1 Tax=Bifidobacterium sp. ESL0728 TaxID=2983220 RepID=UPI0023F91703|nr:UvrD-helicase domain-containing protein [Bifidobacterium sp. ESL0728]WEV58681.1 UvrD-helicase domain-containing protein [Bifidobacterium sp. ESL0728]